MNRIPIPNWINTFLFEPWEFLGYLWLFLLLAPMAVTSVSSTLRELDSLVSASSLCSESLKDERNRSHLFESAITWWFGMSTNRDKTLSLVRFTVLTTGHRIAMVITRVPMDIKKRIRIISFFWIVRDSIPSTLSWLDSLSATKKSLNTLYVIKKMSSCDSLNWVRFRCLAVKTALEIWSTASVNENFRVFKVDPCSLKKSLTDLVSESYLCFSDISSEERDIEFCRS